MRTYAAVFLCILALALTACHKRAATEGASNSQAKLDACAFLTKEEIQAVQGSTVTATKGSESSDGNFRISQCFFTTAESNRSVSFVVTQRDPGSQDKRSPTDFWKETFGSYHEGEEKESPGDKEKKESLREQSRAKGEEEKGAPPKKIKGIGDDAYWVGNRVGGALYVLKKNTIVRISLGGPDKEEARIEKSKTLAAKALGRL
ncbi:MAG: hypothetical protein QOI22_1276 [Verrucomicrobiota bacterium]